MPLRQNNISVPLVQSTIGVYSTSSIGGLIAKAIAFYIYETRTSNGNQGQFIITPTTIPITRTQV